jgi:tyrosyl-tRNA synthetase
MGKTVGGAVWLNAEMRSPYDYWQFWRNTEDADVARFMKLFTDLPASEIAEHAKAEGAAINDAKKRLADVATTMLHGEQEAKKAAAAAEAVFQGGGTSEGMPTFEVPRAQIAAGYSLLDALVAGKLAASKGEAKRAVAEKSVKLNGETVADAAAVIDEAALDDDGAARLSVGKKRHARLKAV